MGASGEPVGVTRSIVILGAGIVGSALAAYLCEQGGLMVTVLEAGPPERLIGSTGHAPGYLGVFNEVSVATELARASAEKYEQIRYGGRAGFDRVGGLEVATTPGGMADLERRATLAVEAGVPVRVLAPEQAASAAPALVDPRRCTGGLLYPHHPRRVWIWGPAVLAVVGQILPLTPVAHPYVYGPAHGKLRGNSAFVRWPEHHVYARDHGARFGLGTYDHNPLAVDIAARTTDAEQPWVAGNSTHLLHDPRQPAAARPDGRHRRAVGR